MDSIETLKKQSAYIDKGIEKISASLNNVLQNLNLSKPELIRKFEEETETLHESLNDLIKILSKSTEEQELLLLECVTMIKETSNLTNKYIENNLDFTDNVNETHDYNCTPNINQNDLEYDIDDCSEPIKSTIELSSAYDLLNKSIPDLL